MPGLGCSKLTTSLVNVSLKFQTLISQVCQYFLLKKCEELLQCKSFSHFSNKKYQCFWLSSRKSLKSWPLNELVKLTMLWTTRSWRLISVDWFSAEIHSFKDRLCFIRYHFYSKIGKKTGAPRIFKTWWKILEAFNWKQLEKFTPDAIEKLKLIC